VLDEEHVGVAPAIGNLNCLRGEIRGSQGVPMPLDEVVSGPFLGQWFRLETGLTKEVPGCRASEPS
jgi:hypothetical protein